jgi:serine O-acetyltransferase
MADQELTLAVPRTSVLSADLRRAWDKARGGRLSRALTCLRSPGVQAVIVLRFGQWLMRWPRALRWPLDVLYLLLHAGVKIAWGIEVPRQARVGPGLYIGHYGGIFVNPGSVLGRNVTLSQGVTIGDNNGTPVVGDNVYIAAGAKVFGPIRVGNNVKIGANAVVHADLPDNSVVALSPGFVIVSMKGNRREEVFDG